METDVVARARETVRFAPTTSTLKIFFEEFSFFADALQLDFARKNHRPPLAFEPVEKEKEKSCAQKEKEKAGPRGFQNLKPVTRPRRIS